MQEKTEAIPMNERVKRYVPISNAADRFGVSRPTFYLLMQNYDDGKTSDMDENIRGFFDLIASNPQPEEVKVYLTVKGGKDAENSKPIKIKEQRNEAEYETAMKEIESSRVMLERTEAEYRSCINELKRTQKESVLLKRLIEENPEDCAEYKVRYSSVVNKIDNLNKSMAKLEEQRQVAHHQMIDAECNLKRIASSRDSRSISRMDSWTDDNGLMTLCVGNNGRSMILFQLLSDETVENPKFFVTLHLETPSGDLVVGRYIPDQGKSFVTIDDVLPNLRLQYEVRCEYQNQSMSSGRYPLQFK